MVDEEPKKETEEKSNIEEAKELLEEIKKTNTETKELLLQYSRVRAEQILSGKADAGQPLKKSETDEEKINREAKEWTVKAGYPID